MQLFHIYHHTKLHRLIHSQFWLFDFSVWLHSFSRSLIAVFIPIFLLQVGYDVESVIFYYFIYNIFDVPWNFIARRLIRCFGAKIVIILGSFISVLFFLVLFSFDEKNIYWLFLLAFLAAVYDALYWVSHIYLFMKCSEKSENVSGEASFLDIARRLAGIVAPALGAVIMILFSEKALIIFSVLLLIVSILPILKIKNINDKPERKQQTIKGFFSGWKMMKDYISTSFWAIHNAAENVIWPIFIFITFDNIESVAVLPIIISIATIVFTYFVGHIRKEKRDKTIAFGAIMICLIWIMRLLIKNNVFYYFSVFLMGVFSVFVSIPLDSYIFEKGKKLDALTTSTFRNTAHMSSNAIFFGVLLIVIEIFHFSFVMATVSMFVVFLVSFLLNNYSFKKIWH